VASVRAAAGGPSGGGPGPSEDSSRRSLLLNLLAVAVSVPVAKELLQDLGQGIDEEGNAFVRARAASSAPSPLRRSAG
jgi:hypothetical protein